MAVITAKSFANSFWGRDDIGYEVLTSKMSNAKKTCEDLKSLYNLKTTLHDELGRKLLKHARMGIGRDETGTMHDLLETVRKEVEINAQAHIDLSLKIRNSLELPLENFILEQKDKRKLVQTTVDKAHRNKQLHSAYVTKAKEKYDSECSKQANLESQLPSALPRDADRLKHKLDRCKQEVETLDSEYQTACLKLTEATAIWNAEWKIACDRYQDMEQSRIEFIRDGLSVYINLVSGISAEERESLERISSCIEQTNITEDIDTFIDEQGTGPMIPGKFIILKKPPIYTNYFDDKVEPPLPKYQIAKFAPMPYADDNKSGIASRHLSLRSEIAPPPVPSKSPRTPAIKPPIAQMIQNDTATEQLLQRRANLYSSSEKIKNNPNPSMRVPMINIPGEDNSDDNEDDDHTVDPRANILVKLGGNVFELESSETRGSSVDPLSTTQDRRNRRNSSSNLKIDEDFDLSIRDLLQELGVHDKPADQQKRQARKEVATMPQAGLSEPPASYYTSGQAHEAYMTTSAPQHVGNEKHYFQSEPQHVGYHGSQEQMYYNAQSQQQSAAYVEYGETYPNQQSDMAYYHASYPQEQPYAAHEAYYPAANPHDTTYTYVQQPHSLTGHPQMGQPHLSYGSASNVTYQHNSSYPLQWDGNSGNSSQQYYS